MLVAQLHAAVDDRVDYDAAGERFVCVERHFPGLPELAGDFIVIARGGEDVGEPARSFDAALRTREILRREESGSHAVLRRAARVERLAHRAEHLAQSR